MSLSRITRALSLIGLAIIATFSAAFTFPWKAPRGAVEKCGAHDLKKIDLNIPALRLFFRERSELPSRSEPWFVLVPGTSEQWGHHKAPPRDEERKGVLISEEFEARLGLAVRLMEADAARFMVISGGSVDSERPDYNEAKRGRELLLSKRPELANRVFIDPLALHSTNNVRNGAKLAVELGMKHLLVATTMPVGPGVFEGPFSAQGWYYLHSTLSTFRNRSMSELGYMPGEFKWFEAKSPIDDGISALEMHSLDRRRLLEDCYWP